MNDYTKQQQEAIDHLREWRVGALFMEPGTGKTRAAMTLINLTDCSDCFWIGPLRTFPAIQMEMAKWGGMRMPTSCWGVESLSMSDRIYMNLLSEVEKARDPFIVVDESLKIKNAEAKRTQRVLEIGKRARWKLVLNGTPVTRNLMDMWPQMEFLSPKILSMSLREFKNTFLKWTRVTKRDGYRQYTKEYVTGMENVDYLHSLIRHYVYECDLQLKIQQKWHTVGYNISDESRERYNEVKDDYLKDEMLEWSNNNIFMAMTTDMQRTYHTDEAKLDAVRMILRDVDPRKTIIFCRWVDSRELCQDTFKDCAVLSMQKESLGLNLQQYTTTIYFDKVWDYALYQQSTRRTFRTGQEQDCHYYELTANTGLDAMIDKNIRNKVTMSEYLKRVSLEELRKTL
jgi:SNF2 family DNA or RNA helicase